MNPVDQGVLRSFVPFMKKECTYSEALKSGRTVMKVDDVFPVSVLDKANLKINDIPVIKNFRNKDSVFRVNLHENPDNAYSSFATKRMINFDDSSSITNPKEVEELCNMAPYPEVIDLAKKGVEKMASVVGWRSTSVLLTVNILRYQLNAEHPKIDDLPWHYDQAAILTMTTLITPYQQGDYSFSGGNLSFRRKDNPTQSAQLKFAFGEKSMITDSVISFDYPYNGGFIFDNINTEHKVTDINFQSSSGCIERRLFSIFADPPQKEVISLSGLSRNLV
jgi:hypothetical protein